MSDSNMVPCTYCGDLINTDTDNYINFGNTTFTEIATLAEVCAECIQELIQELNGWRMTA